MGILFYIIGGGLLGALLASHGIFAWTWQFWALSMPYHILAFAIFVLSED